MKRGLSRQNWSKTLKTIEERKKEKTSEINKVRDFKDKDEGKTIKKEDKGEI